MDEDAAQCDLYDIDDLRNIDDLQDLDDVERLLPPHTTEYRSGSVLTLLRKRYEEPATVPDLRTVRPN